MVAESPDVNMNPSYGILGSLRLPDEKFHSRHYELNQFQYPHNFDMSPYNLPDVNAHMLRGVKVCVLRWEVVANSAPEILDKLLCKCGRHLLEGVVEEDQGEGKF